jgi:hypothetical protein
MMNGQLLEKASVLFTVCVLAVGCGDRAMGPTVPTPQPPPPPQSAIAELAGLYTLTVTLGEQCSALPETVRRRTYQANLVATPYAYLAISLVGGGFTEPVVTGDLWPAPNGQITIDWNNFDIGGCDGYPEPLSDGTALMVCGGGSGTANESTITFDVAGQVFVDSPGRRERVCSGLYQFTFSRSAGS